MTNETISHGVINPEKIGYVRVAHDVISKYKMISGDILFSHINSVEHIGKTAIYEDEKDELYHGVNLLLLRPKMGLVYPKYLLLYLKRPDVRGYFQTRCKKAVNQASLNQKDILQIGILLPSLPTQRRFVSILEKADETKRFRAQADELTDRLLQSVFLEMFGDPVRNPKGWETKTMNEVCERITDGEHVTPQRTDEGIYLLSARNIQNHKIALDDVDFIGEEEYERISKRIRPQKGDILISCSGTIGRVTRVKENFKFQLVRSVALVRPIIAYAHPIYLEYIFTTNLMKNQIKKAVNQSSQANLFQGKIRKLFLPLPPLPLQQEFARIVEKIESMRQSQSQSKQQIEDLFSALMQKAFRGEI